MLRYLLEVQASMCDLRNVSGKVRYSLGLSVFGGIFLLPFSEVIRVTPIDNLKVNA